MPFIADDEQQNPSNQGGGTPPAPTGGGPASALAELGATASKAAQAGAKASNPIVDKLSDPNTTPDQKKAILNVMKGEAQNQRGLLDKFLGGLQSTADFFDKKVFFGKAGFGDISSKSAGRLAGDFGGTAVEATSKLLADAKIIDKPVDYGFEKDLNEITSSPSNIAKVWGMAALEMWPGGTAGKSIAKEASTELASKIPLVGEIAARGVGGAFDVASKIAAPVKNLGSKVTSSITSRLPKIAEFFTNVASKNFQFIKENPELFREVKNFAEDETAIPSFGQRLFDLAKKLKTTASSEWQKNEATILKNAEGKLQSGLTTLQSEVADKFSKEKIIPGAEGAIDYSKSAFSQNGTAQGVLDRLHKLVTAPIETVEELLTKRSEITDLVEEIPKTSRNLKRIVNGVVTSFDNSLNTITGGQAEAMRNAYKAKVGPAYEIIDKMTDGSGKFSMDKASAYVKTLMSEAKFDSKQAVEELQKQLANAGITTSDLTKEAQGLAVAKATNKLAPPTGSRVKDVVFTYGIGKVPILSALVSPKFWAEAIERTGAKVSMPTLRKTAAFLKDDIIKLIMQKVLTFSVDNILNKSNTENSDINFSESTPSNTPSPNFVPDEATPPAEGEVAPTADQQLDPNANENGQIFFF